MGGGGAGWKVVKEEKEEEEGWETIKLTFDNMLFFSI